MSSWARQSIAYKDRYRISRNNINDTLLKLIVIRDIIMRMMLLGNI